MKKTLFLCTLLSQAAGANGDNFRHLGLFLGSAG